MGSIFDLSGVADDLEHYNFMSKCLLTIHEIEDQVAKYDYKRGGAFTPNECCTFAYDTYINKVYVTFPSDTMYCPLLPYFSSEKIANRILYEVGENNIKMLFKRFPVIRSTDSDD